LADLAERESIEQLILHLEEKVSNRANIIIAANSFLFNAFAILVASKITGNLVWIPLIICLLGIGINLLILSNKAQISKITSSLNQYLDKEEGKDLFTMFSTSFFYKHYFNPGDNKTSTFSDIFNMLAPLLMIAGWIGCIIILKTFG
jgi:hypothetical protein